MPNKSDPAAERAVVAGVFAYGNDAYLDVSDLVTPRTFTIDSNDVIYRCLEHIFEQDPEARPDVPSVLSAANALGLGKRFEDREEARHLRNVLNMPVERRSVRRLAGKIRKLEVARLLDGQLEQAQASLDEVTGDEPIAHIIGLVENPIFDLTSLLADTGSRDVVPMGEGALEHLTHLMDHPVDMVGIPTGLKNYDRAVGGGVRVNALDLIAARQKEGKTFLVDNIAVNIARLSVRVLNVDTEMSKEEHQVRVLANLAGLDIRKIEEGKYGTDRDARRRLEEAARQLESLPYDYLAANGMEFEEVLAFMRRWIKRKVGLGEEGKAKPCVIIYDWLKLNSTVGLHKNLAEHQMLGFVTSGLKNFMTRYGARCLCFAQLNRDGIDSEDTSVIRGSDRILDFVTSFSLFKKKSDDEQAEELGQRVRYTHKLIPLISRFGPGLDRGDYINVRALYHQGRVEEGPTARGLAAGQGGPRGEFVSDAQDDDGVAFG